MEYRFGHLPAVFPHQPWQFANTPKTRPQGSRLGKDPENPAEVKAIGPHRDAHLIARDEAGRRADAVNAGPVSAGLFQVIADLVLHAAADGDNNVFWLSRTNDFEQSFILNAIAAAL